MGTVISFESSASDDEKWLKTSATRLFDPQFLGTDCAKVCSFYFENDDFGIQRIKFEQKGTKKVIKPDPRIIETEFDRTLYNLHNLRTLTPGNSDLYEVQTKFLGILRVRDNTQTMKSALFRHKLRLSQLVDVFVPLPYKMHENSSPQTAFGDELQTIGYISSASSYIESVSLNCRKFDPLLHSQKMQRQLRMNAIFRVHIAVLRSSAIVLIGESTETLNAKKVIPIKTSYKKLKTLEGSHEKYIEVKLSTIAELSKRVSGVVSEMFPTESSKKIDLDKLYETGSAGTEFPTDNPNFPVVVVVSHQFEEDADQMLDILLRLHIGAGSFEPANIVSVTEKPIASASGATSRASAYSKKKLNENNPRNIFSSSTHSNGSGVSVLHSLTTTSTFRPSTLAPTPTRELVSPGAIASASASASASVSTCTNASATGINPRTISEVEENQQTLVRSSSDLNSVSRSFQTGSAIPVPVPQFRVTESLVADTLSTGARERFATPTPTPTSIPDLLLPGDICGE